MSISLANAILANKASSSNAGSNDILNWLHRLFLIAFLQIAPEKQITFKASVRQRGQSILWSIAKSLPLNEAIMASLKSNMGSLDGDGAQQIKDYHNSLLDVPNSKANVTGTITDRFDTFQFLRNMDKAGHKEFRTSFESAVMGEVGTEGVTHFNLVMGINAKGYPTVLGFQAEAEATEQAPEPAVEQSADEEIPFSPPTPQGACNKYPVPFGGEQFANRWDFILSKLLGS